MSENKELDLKAMPFPEQAKATLAAAAAGAGDADICEKLEELLDDAIRKECSKKQFDIPWGNCGDQCRTVEEPSIVPCFHLRWGDGPQDHLETDDTEVLCLTVCNPYSNVVLKDFTVQIVVTTATNGAIPPQADGTPSVMIRPQFNICFDDIPACDPKDPKKSCVSREVVLIDRGAVPGQYKVFVFYCFEACFTKFSLRNPAIFTLDLVAS